MLPGITITRRSLSIKNRARRDFYKIYLFVSCVRVCEHNSYNVSHQFLDILRETCNMCVKRFYHHRANNVLFFLKKIVFWKPASIALPSISHKRRWLFFFFFFKIYCFYILVHISSPDFSHMFTRAIRIQGRFEIKLSTHLFEPSLEFVIYTRPVCNR